MACWRSSEQAMTCCGARGGARVRVGRGHASRRRRHAVGRRAGDGEVIETAPQHRHELGARREAKGELGYLRRLDGDLGHGMHVERVGWRLVQAPCTQRRVRAAEGGLRATPDAVLFHPGHQPGDGPVHRFDRHASRVAMAEPDACATLLSHCAEPARRAARTRRGEGWVPRALVNSPAGWIERWRGGAMAPAPRRAGSPRAEPASGTHPRPKPTSDAAQPATRVADAFTAGPRLSAGGS